MTPEVTEVAASAFAYPGWFFFLLFALAMVVSSIGFKNYVWFISLGYGFSIAAAGVLMLILFHKTLTLGTVICCVIFFLYGCRLGGYLAYRELKSSSYKKNMVGEIKDGSKVPMGVKLAIWITCALLYATQVSPVFFRMWNAPAGVTDNVMVFVGAVIMVSGITLESAADIQKNKAKKVNPKRWVDTGLFRIVRCPNYLGELVAVGPLRCRLLRHHLRHVLRRPPSGGPPKQALRQGSRVPEVRQDRAHPAALRPALQRGEVQVAGGLMRK